MGESSNGVFLPGGMPAQGKPAVNVVLQMRVVPHAPLCPECGSSDITIDQVTVDGIEETAYICENGDCGAAWPLACVCEWSR
jgi:hypothetical protein